MDDHDRANLLATGAPRAGETWCDMGCGDGAFALPLIDKLGARGKLIAIDRDEQAVASLAATLHKQKVARGRFELRISDLAAPGPLPPLDGALFANSLHYLADAAVALGIVRAVLKPGARILVLEYDRADANPWVPYPIPAAALADLARSASLPPFEVKGRVRSDFGRTVYAAVSVWR